MDVKVVNGEESRCFFVLRGDGSEDDFSYRKCMLNMSVKKLMGPGQEHKFTELESLAELRDVDETSTRNNP